MLQATEQQLAWLMYLIGALIGARMEGICTDAADELDGELICRALETMRVADQRLRICPPRIESLECAVLFFFKNFRIAYIGADSIPKISKVFARLNDTLGLADETAVLEVFISKIVTNLKLFASNGKIIERTLRLLSDLSVGYSSVRRLAKLGTIQLLLQHHTSEHFPFLTLLKSRYRTDFYLALGRFLVITNPIPCTLIPPIMY